MKVKEKKPQCLNCKHASDPYKLADKTFYICGHSKHIAQLESGEITFWDTLRVSHNTCPDHEFKPVKL